MIGAILTQNTNWANVAKAISNLKEKNMLDPYLILKKKRTLPELIRPSGYYNIKARRLLAFVEYFINVYQASTMKMAKKELSLLRSDLISIPGIGRETADSIILYALNKPVFVIDAYTRRILLRHGMINTGEDYDDVRMLFERSLPRDLKLYQEFHALLVLTGKKYCKKNDPLCADCPLADLRDLS